MTLQVDEFDLINPLVVASSPATHGSANVIRSAQALPGAVVMRNYRHGRGGGCTASPSVSHLRTGGHGTSIHSSGGRLGTPYANLAAYADDVKLAREGMPCEVKLWCSVGGGGQADLSDWVEEAKAAEDGGADAIELHLNTPGIVEKISPLHIDSFVHDAIHHAKSAVSVPVYAKLPLENTNAQRVLQVASDAGADALGPSARWRGLQLELDASAGEARPGSGFGGTQSLPIISYVVARARLNGIRLPLFAGGGVFTWQDVAKLILAGSHAVQIGTAACLMGPRHVAAMRKGLQRWIGEQGTEPLRSLTGRAVPLLEQPGDSRPYVDEYLAVTPDPQSCTKCGRCYDVCWHDAIHWQPGAMPHKTDRCIGCGYCVQVCPENALKSMS